jgi:hypothetical protein
MTLLNPMGTTGTWQGNYQQPDTTAHVPNAAVASYPVGANVLNISQPVPKYQQPLATTDDPSGTFQA